MGLAFMEFIRLRIGCAKSYKHALGMHDIHGSKLSIVPLDVDGMWLLGKAAQDET